MKLICFLVLVTLLVGCANQNPYILTTDALASEDTYSTLNSNNLVCNSFANSPINSYSNTVNGGSFFYFDGFVYGLFYKASYDYPDYYCGELRLGKERVSTGEVEILKHDKYVTNICVTNDRIYYKDSAVGSISASRDEGGIYSLSLDGTDEIRITDDLVDIFFIYNGLIYYLTHSNSRSVIIECDLSGNKLREIYSANTELYSESFATHKMKAFSIYNGNLYIAENTGTGSRLFSVSIEDKTVTDCLPCSFEVKSINSYLCAREGEHIYFQATNVDDTVSLYKMNVIMREISQKLPATRHFLIQDGYLFTGELDWDEDNWKYVTTLRIVNLLNCEERIIRIDALLDDFEVCNGDIYFLRDHSREYSRVKIDKPDYIESITQILAFKDERVALRES